jgi:hypothetical protein
MRPLPPLSATDDGFISAMARWENEGGALRAAPGRLPAHTQHDQFEHEIAQAAHMAGLDDEGAYRPFHSFPWAIRLGIVE